MRKIPGMVGACLMALTCHAEGAQAVKKAAQKDWCTRFEHTLFSCSAEGQVMSLCVGFWRQRSLQFRMGQATGQASLIYPAERETPSFHVYSHFGLDQPYPPLNYGLTTLHFRRASTLYDLILPGLEGEFVGLQTTDMQHGQHSLLRCEPGSVVSPEGVEFELGEVWNDEGDGSTSEDHAVAYPRNRRRIEHPGGWVSTISYPELPDPQLQREVMDFAHDCYGDYRPSGVTAKGGECRREVEANLVLERYLVLLFQNDGYARAIDKKNGATSFKTYVKTPQGWREMQRGTLLDNSPACRTRAGFALLRLIGPGSQRSTLPASETAAAQALLDRAVVTPALHGLNFNFVDDGPFYGYSEVKLSEDELGACWLARGDRS